MKIALDHVTKHYQMCIRDSFKARDIPLISAQPMRFTVPLCCVVVDDGIEPTITAFVEDTVNRRFRARFVNVDDDGMQWRDDRRNIADVPS